MNIDGIIWLTQIEDKLVYKHHVETYEVEEVLGNKAKFRDTFNQGIMRVKISIWR